MKVEEHHMISTFLEQAKSGKSVYISSAYQAFQALEEGLTIHCLLSLLEEGKERYFPLRIPELGLSEESDTFIHEYVWAELYNIISSLGGRKMDLYVDEKNDRLVHLCSNLNRVFSIEEERKDRKGYGRAVNVTDRMLETLAVGADSFHFALHPLSDLPETRRSENQVKGDLGIFTRVTEHLEEKSICGIDVGGTDIKLVLVNRGRILCFKEYDWFPAMFTRSIQLVEPIHLLVRLMRAVFTLSLLDPSSSKDLLLKEQEKALILSAEDQVMEAFCLKVETFAEGQVVNLDAIGICFPDVVVKDKIVGGEVYKTRGIRNNPDIEYESDFRTLTDLDDHLSEFLREGGNIRIINDGPMASFTAAVEIAASENPELISRGVFAHTLGTELGTGWVDETGAIPDIPLEVYNYIIDLGSYPERAYQSDDLRSLNNFNTGLPGTLQKYASQSGIFRLAMKYFPAERPDLFAELQEKGFIQASFCGEHTVYTVPAEPEDMRKPFLEHMMALVEREQDEVNERIWRELGEFLAVTWLETKKILNPAADARFLFGRLVKKKRCFLLMCEGARSIRDDIRFEIADSTLANTPLMKELEADPHFSVAQFAQAIGAVYFANQ